MTALIRSLAVALLAGVLWLPAARASLMEMHVFGDSLSDTGNVFALTGGVLPPGPASPLPGPYFEGRVSNGPVWVDDVAARLQLTLSNVWSDGLAAGPGVINNFATAGAFTGSLAGFANSNDFSLLSFFYPPGTLPLPGLQQQVDAYVAAAPAASADAWHVIWAGANDLIFAPDFGASPDDPLLIAAAVNNIRTAILDLAAVGATEFLVLNLPDLGATPFAIGEGMITEFSNGTDLFNASLAAMLGGLTTTPGIEIMTLDIYELFEELLADPLAAGFPGVGVSPLPPGVGPCFNQDVPAFLCDLFTEDPNLNIFWDLLHPSSRTHGLIADAVLATKVPVPGTLALLIVLGGLGFSSRSARRRWCRR